MIWCVVSERRLSAFICRELSIRYPFGVEKEEGVLTLTGGSGQTVDILPADDDSWAAAEVISERLISFPLAHNEFRIVGADGTDLRVFMGLEIEVSGFAGDAVLRALGLQAPEVQVA